MHQRLKLLVVVAIFGAAAYGGTVLATPPSAGTTFSMLAPLAELDEIKSKAKSGDWEAKLKTKGTSDLYLTEITVPPFGNGGWHSHPGPSLIVVKSGTLKFYEADDPTCTADVFTSGSGLFEPADNVHIVRNETADPLVLVVVQFVGSGAPRRLDQPSPGNCPF